MKWRKRLADIERLKLAHGRTTRSRRRSRPPEFPDLSTAKPGIAPTSDRITRVVYPSARGAHHPDAIEHPVGHSHKQGLELITPGTDVSWMGGKKS